VRGLEEELFDVMSSLRLIRAPLIVPSATPLSKGGKLNMFFEEHMTRAVSSCVKCKQNDAFND
jgi:hypothetical protein